MFKYNDSENNNSNNLEPNDNENKKEKWYNKKWFTITMLIFFFPVGIYLMWKNEHFTKPVRKGISIFFVLLAIVVSFNQNDKDIASNNEQTNVEKDDEDNEAEKEIDTAIEADLNVKIADNKVNVEIKTNAIDGSIFEFFILDNEIEAITEFITIKDGVGKASLDVNENWKPGYLGAGASMRFNLDEHPQPEEVRKLYGEHGEKLEGELIEKNNLEGYNVNVKTDPIPYPDAETAKKVSEENLNTVITEIIDISEGIIESIEPLYDEKGWSIVKVVVSDAWYYSADYEKERFAEEIGETVKQLILSSGIMPEEKTVSVYFYDTYNKELASPKVLGGYKIKR